MCIVHPPPFVDRRFLDNSSKKSVTTRWILTILVIVVLSDSTSASVPMVETKFGQIRGKWSLSARGRSVANYLGIPYAEPPIGELRFKSPRAWNATFENGYDASKDAPKCIQRNVFGDITGLEDCLYLNVFVPMVSGNRDLKDKLPVMVFVHGGAFNTGSSRSRKYAPDYLMDQKVILVTLNYRLGIMGFFSTTNRAAPGNNGIKDVLMALRWVNENIESFQGDPNSVTLWGHSAGAAIVHFLALTNKTEGLFDKYILHSGSALASWSIHPRNTIRRASLDVARILGCRNSLTSVDETVVEIIDEGNLRNESTQADYDTGDSQRVVEDFEDEEDEAVVDCMRSLSAIRILHITDYFSIWANNPYCIFGPTIEEESEEAIVTTHPLTAIENRMFRDIPWIVGVVEQEGLLKSLNILTNRVAEDEMESNFEAYLPYVLEYHEIISNTTAFATAVEDFYYGGNVTGKLTYNITELLGDGLITWPTYRAVKSQSQLMNSSTFFFYFAYEGTFSSTFSSGSPIHYGVAHSDDLNYLFPIFNNMYSDQLLHNTEDDTTMINVMTEMWSNFAAEGVPRAWRIPKWPNYAETQDHLRFGIGKWSDVVVESIFLPERMAFWEDLTANMTVDTVELEIILKNPPPEEHKRSFALSLHRNSVSTLVVLTFIYFF